MDTSRFVDLSHELEDGMPVYPGLDRPRIGAIVDHDGSRARYGDAAEFYLGCISTPCNVGTYIDAPFHRYAEGHDLARIDLASVAGLPGIAFDARPIAGPVELRLEHAGDLSGKAVLFRTGWDRLWGTDAYWEAGPHLSSETVAYLVKEKPALVGVDFWNVDDISDPARPAHTQLLGAGILIVEHLRGLSQLPNEGFRFFAPALRVVRGASFPVRAFAEVEG